ncbi:MAG: glycosyltransferase, partial [Bacteroidetes bacterium]|nr:glycosyltransferase [Bacteroidota bacterium]
YKTDPFFVVANDQGIYGHPQDVQEILFTAFRMNRDAEVRKALLAEFMDSEGNLRKVTSDDEYLIQSRRLLQQGDAKRALEVIDQFIRRNPDHHEGNRIKVTALERLRRHVEAAELKHSLQKRGKEVAENEERAARLEKESEKIPESESKELELSVVIPTTGHGKPLLEQALLHLDHAADPETTELIVVDNASIDDTFDYLEQLKEEGFFHIRVITHSVNRGFGASVNAGIEAAKAPLVLIMHNDVQLPENGIEVLKKGLLHSDDTAVAAPLLSDTRNPDQKEEYTTGEPYRRGERVESCCFMVKKDLPIRFDEEYRLCFYDMEDFCKQILESDLEIIIAENVVAEHQKGSTIKMMGIELDPELKWRNRERFFNKWGGNRTFHLPTQGSHPEKFRSLGAPDNPMNPDFEWVQTVQDYLTNEVRTEILREEWSEEEFFTIILTLLIADERELLRTLEERMDGLQPDTSLLVLFIHYYFKKNIYSRCKHYMNMAGNGHPVFDLYRLKIMVADKEFDRAIPLLNDLLGEHPSSPELFYLAGEMYKKNEEEGEAQSFFAMAGQLDPYRFKENEGSFEIDI